MRFVCDWVDVGQIVKSHRFVREFFFAKAAVAEGGNDGVQHRQQRHADDHTDKAKQPFAERQSGNDPNAVEAGILAKQSRANDVAVNLLQYDDKDDNDDEIDRAVHQSEQRAGYRTDKRAEDRDDIGHAHNNRHQFRIRHSQHQ